MKIIKKAIKGKGYKIEEEKYFDDNDKPIISFEHPLKRIQGFDIDGNLISEMNYYGETDSAGIVIRGSKYDKSFHPIERTYYDQTSVN